MLIRGGNVALVLRTGSNSTRDAFCHSQRFRAGQKQMVWAHIQQNHPTMADLLKSSEFQQVKQELERHFGPVAIGVELHRIGARFMASAEQLKQLIDLHELADRLGMERPDPNGNYRAPNRPDKHPSVSIFDAGKAGYMMWKDHTSGEKGSCLDLVIYCGQAMDASEAMKWLHEEFNIPTDDVAPQQQNLKANWHGLLKSNLRLRVMLELT